MRGEVPSGDLISGDVALDDLVATFARLERGEGIKFAVRPVPAATAETSAGENP